MELIELRAHRRPSVLTENYAARCGQKYDNVMKCTLVLAATSLSFLGLGCAPPVMTPVLEPAPAVTQPPMVDAVLTPDAKPIAANMRAPGDFVIYRFSGSYREAPITLSQRVVKREHGYLVVDVKIDDGGSQQRLRLRIGDEGTERAGELVSVARLIGNVQHPFGKAAFDELMNGIMLTADENEGLIDTASMVIDIAGDKLPCTVSSYRVRVGAHDAVMTTLSSPAFAWGHVGGEIATSDGRLLYKAEIVDLGGPGMTESVAVQADLDAYDELDALDLE